MLGYAEDMTPTETATWLAAGLTVGTVLVMLHLWLSSRAGRAAGEPRGRSLSVGCLLWIALSVLGTLAFALFGLTMLSSLP